MHAKALARVFREEYAMALVITGMQCPICEQVVEEHDEVVAFGPNGATEPDPLALFNDAFFHRHCFEEHPHAQAALDRWREVDANHPRHRRN